MMELGNDFRYRLADLLRDLHQRRPEAIEAANEVIALFRQHCSAPAVTEKL